MFKGKLFWYTMMAGAIGGWILGISGLVRPSKNDVIKKGQQAVLCIWALGHPLELPVALMVGKKTGVSLLRTIVKTLLFGFTWWLPLKMGVIKK